MQPEIIEGKFNVDDRGDITLHDIPANIERFYFIGAHKEGFVRAWHGHKEETKYCVVVKGAILIGVVEVDNWDEPKTNKISTYILSDKEPEMLYIPPGYANGFKFLTDDTKVLFLSTSTIEESAKDDYRFPALRWNIWRDEWR